VETFYDTLLHFLLHFINFISWEAVFRAKKNFKETTASEKLFRANSPERKKTSFAESKWQAEKGEFLVLWPSNDLVFKLRLCDLGVCM